MCQSCRQFDAVFRERERERERERKTGASGEARADLAGDGEMART